MLSRFYRFFHAGRVLYRKRNPTKFKISLLDGSLVVERPLELLPRMRRPRLYPSRKVSAHIKGALENGVQFYNKKHTFRFGTRRTPVALEMGMCGMYASQVRYITVKAKTNIERDELLGSLSRYAGNARTISFSVKVLKVTK